MSLASVSLSLNVSVRATFFFFQRYLISKKLNYSSRISYFFFFSLFFPPSHLTSYIFSTYDFVSFATTDRSFPFSIICRDGPSAIDFSRGTWLPATEPEGKRGVRSGKRSTTIWHEARRWLPAPLSPFFPLFFLSTLVAFWPQGSNESVSTRRRKFRENEHGENEIYPFR